MKEIKLIILIVLFAFIDVMSQRPPNAIYLSYQPWDHGLGLRYDQHFSKAGIYGSATYGTLGLYKVAGLKDHFKFTAGLLIPIRDYMGSQHVDISVGLNRHFVNTFYVNSSFYDISKIANMPWSFELGLTIKMSGIIIAFRTDILRWEPCLDIGIPLNFK